MSITRGTVSISVDDGESVFFWQEKSRGRPICLSDNPEALALVGLIGTQDPIAIIKRLVVESPVVRANFAPIIADVTTKEFKGRLSRRFHGRDCTSGGNDLAEGKRFDCARFVHGIIMRAFPSGLPSLAARSASGTSTVRIGSEPTRYDHATENDSPATMIMRVQSA